MKKRPKKKRAGRGTEAPVVEPVRDAGVSSPTVVERPKSELHDLIRDLGLAGAAVIGRLENVRKDIEHTNPRMHPIKATTKDQWHGEICRAISDMQGAIDRIPLLYRSAAA